MSAVEAPVERRRVGGLWWQRDFRLLWIGETTSGLGTVVSEVAIPLLAVLVLHANAFSVGALTAVAWAPWLVVGLPAGAWVDRMPRKPVLITADLVTVVALASVPVAAWCHVLGFAQLFAVALVTGVARVFFMTAYRAYLPTLVDKPDIAEANAKLQGSEAFANVAGPGLAGVISQLLGVVTGLLLDAISSLVSAVCLLCIRKKEPEPEPETEVATLRARIAEGVRLTARDPFLRTFALAGAAANFALNMAQAVLVLFLIRVIGVGAAGVGGVLAVMSVGGLAGAAAANWLGRRLGTARAVLAGELGAAGAGLLIGFSGRGAGIVFALVGGFFLIGGIVLSNVLQGGFRQTYCPQELLGRITASSQFVNFGAVPLGALLGGALGDAIGLRPTMVLSTIALVLACSVLFTGPIRHLRDLPEQMRVPVPV
jgi:predicted MFS family arabinose efflux permease